MLPLLAGLCIVVPGAPIRLCISVLGLTKSLAAFACKGAPSGAGGTGITVAGVKPRFRGTDLLWSTPAVLRIDGLSAWGSNLGRFTDGAAVPLPSALTCAARAE